MQHPQVRKMKVKVRSAVAVQVNANSLTPNFALSNLFLAITYSAVERQDAVMVNSQATKVDREDRAEPRREQMAKKLSKNPTTKKKRAIR